MSEYLWHVVLYRTADGPRYRTVIVLAWHADGRATVVEVTEDGRVKVGARPMMVSIDSMGIGEAPVEALALRVP